MLGKGVTAEYKLNRYKERLFNVFQYAFQFVG